MSIFPIKENGGERIQYDYASYSAYTGKGCISSCPDYRYPIHWHDDIEFALILQGEMQYNINGTIVHVQEGDGIIINSRQLHYNFSSLRNECEYICVLLHPMLLCVNPSFEKQYITPLLAIDNFPYSKLSKSIPWQSEICEEIRSIYKEQNRPESPLLIQAHFYKIWANLHANVKWDEDNKKDSGNLNIIKTMVDFIQNNYRDNLTLAQIAKSGSVGQSNCCKLFKNYLNLTPNGYLTQCRMDKSRELLRDTGLSITDISELVGYDGASYFSELFRKRYQISPSEYRKNVQ